MSDEFLYQAGGILINSGSIVATGPDGEEAWRIDADGNLTAKDVRVSVKTPHVEMDEPR